MVKSLPANAGNIRDTSSIPGWEDPWRRAWQPAPVFLPRESMDKGAWGATKSMWSQRSRHD